MMQIDSWSGYLAYLLRHKLAVSRRCFLFAWQTRCPRLLWRGLMHDWSKFCLDELLPYGDYFSQPMSRRVGVVQRRFQEAVRLHKSRNRHHPEWWLMSDEAGEPIALEMDDLSILELICDWYGAGVAQGHGDNTRQWYAANRERLPLGPNTRRRIETLIGYDATGR